MPVTPAGRNTAVPTAAGSPVRARVTGAENPFTGVTVTENPAVDPAATDRVVGVAVTAKSGGAVTVRVRVVEWLIVPAAPVTCSW